MLKCHCDGNHCRIHSVAFQKLCQEKKSLLWDHTGSNFLLNRQLFWEWFSLTSFLSLCQGGVLSLALFMIYIDNLLLELEKQGILEASFCQCCPLMHLHLMWYGMYRIINKCVGILRSFPLIRMRWWMGKDERRNEGFSKYTQVTSLFHLLYETLLS